MRFRQATAKPARSTSPNNSPLDSGRIPWHDARMIGIATSIVTPARPSSVPPVLSVETRVVDIGILSLTFNRPAYLDGDVTDIELLGLVNLHGTALIAGDGTTEWTLTVNGAAAYLGTYTLSIAANTVFDEATDEALPAISGFTVENITPNLPPGFIAASAYCFQDAGGTTPCTNGTTCVLWKHTNGVDSLTGTGTFNTNSGLYNSVDLNGTTDNFTGSVVLPADSYCVAARVRYTTAPAGSFHIWGVYGATAGLPTQTWLGSFAVTQSLTVSGGSAGTDISFYTADAYWHTWNAINLAGTLTYRLDRQQVGTASVSNRSGNTLTIGSYAGSLFAAVQIAGFQVVETAAEVSESGLTSLASNAVVSPSTYLFPTFSVADATNGHFRLLTSADGLTFTQIFSLLLPSSVDAKPQAGDYSIHKHGDGYYYIAYTRTRDIEAVVTSFGLSRISTTGNLATWQNLADVDCSAISGLQKVWAGEWFTDPADGKLYCSFSGSNSSSYDATTFKTYLIEATTIGASPTWGTPVQILGTSFIDSFIVESSGTYYLWVKNEISKYIEVYSASSVAGTYASLHTGDWMGIGDGVEGPDIRQFAGTWRLYVDCYNLGQGVKYVEQTSGDWRTGGATVWGSLVAVTAPFVPRHGTIIDA